jgi:hypothetical protein
MDTQADIPGEPFAFPPKRVARMDQCSLAEVYNRLARGEYRAVKDGRKTLILRESIESRRAKLKPATFKPYARGTAS